MGREKKRFKMSDKKKEWPKTVILNTYEEVITPRVEVEIVAEVILEENV